MRQIFVEEFDCANLSDLLRAMADWLDEEKPKVWTLTVEPYENLDEAETQYAGYIFCFPMENKNANSNN